MRLTATPQPGKHWPALLKAAFEHDMPLLARYHVKAPCVLALAIADTYRALQLYTEPDFVLYALRDEAGVACGMVGVEPGSNFLVTFGLAVRCRNAEGLAEFCRNIRNLTDEARPIRCVLYERNLPAQRFLRRMGFVADSQPLLHPDTGQYGILFTLNPS